MGYVVYLYSEREYRKTSNHYGYWCGKTYVVNHEYYPVIESGACEKKVYTHSTTATKSAKKMYDKCGYITGFDIENENGEVIYMFDPINNKDAKPMQEHTDNVDSKNNSADFNNRELESNEYMIKQKILSYIEPAIDNLEHAMNLVECDDEFNNIQSEHIDKIYNKLSNILKELKELT